ncbi:MAG TPA: MarR family transcriptional regulator [Acidimicrobiales bacterium]|nr:MarR family transcriptional regulator [Acidimicrobiales bacterium]
MSGAKTAKSSKASPARWLTVEEREAWKGLQQMHAALSAVLNRQLSGQSGLSLQDYGVLVVLTEQPDGRLRPFELGRELGWEKSRLSHHLSRMAERGLVARESCPADQRGWFVAVTDEGRAAIEAAAPGHVGAVRRSFVDRLTPDQLQAQATIARVVLEGLAAGACDESGCGGD